MDVPWNPYPSRLDHRRTSAPLTQCIELSDFAENLTQCSKTPFQEKALPNQSRQRDGYHVGAVYCASVAGLVFLINMILTAVVMGKSGLSDGLGTVHRGECQGIKNLGVGLHLLLNVLSTLLLSASNYCMQVLSSPTRNDIDNAHRQLDRMDIGVPNVRNLWRISWPRKVVWGLLIVSSIPLHLIYNSAIFETLSGQELSVFAVTEDFLTGAQYHSEGGFAPNNITITNSYFVDLDGTDIDQKLPILQKSVASLKRLDNSECIKTYSAPFGSGWGDLLVVSSHPNSNNSLLGGLSLSEVSATGSKLNLDNAWICCHLVGNDSPCENCDVRKALSNAKTWAYGDYPISYCLGQPPQSNCELQFSMTIMAVVMGLNLIKLLCMTWIAWKMDRKPLVTLGDAIASFLDDPDPTTIGNCIASGTRFLKAPSQISDQPSTWLALPLQHQARRPRWFKAASYGRWLTTTLCCLATLIGTTAMVFTAGNVSAVSISPAAFGVVDPANFLAITGAQGNGYQANLLSAVLIANSFQLLLSSLYFAYNGLFTCMLLAHEWASYAHERKPLRVTTPRGEQRSTYRLSLPYRYSIPLLIMSGLLHWLVSQSIFLMRVKAYTSSGAEDPASDITACGYSPSAILASVIVGFIALLVGIGHGFNRMKAGMPLVGSSSAAISAACHPPLGDDAASLKAVRWGACENGKGEWKVDVHLGGLVGKSGGLGDTRDEANTVQVGHCSFTSFARCEMPVEGEWYAGT